MMARDPLEAMLEDARDTLAPSSADDARLRRALGLGLPVGSPPASIEPRVSAWRPRVLDVRAWRALRASGSAGVLAGAVLVGLGFGAGLWLGPVGGGHGAPRLEPASMAIERATAPVEDGAAPILAPPEVASSPEALARDESAKRAEPAEPAEPRPLRPEPSARRAAREPRRVPSRAHAASPSATGEELALLRRVERALRAENPALALALVAELDQRFPETRLAEEREAAHVIAACGIGEGGARLRAERFLREHGGSVYAERAREACGLREGALRSEGSAPAGDQ